MIDRDDIIRMAREAKLPDPMVFIGAYERFAALVAAEVGIAQYRRGYEEGKAFEREACAYLAEWEPCMTHTPQRIAAAIRARSNT